MIRKLLIITSLMFVSTLALAAGSLRVGMSADYPPLHFKQDGRFQGIEADNAKPSGENESPYIRPPSEL